jgi:hyperosmotically inducible protein
MSLTNRNSLALTLLSAIGAASLAYGQVQPSNPAQIRIQREVMHELLMLPYYNVFDNIEYEVNGDKVVLLGSVIQPTLKTDAENAVKHIEGVSAVDNKIDVEPPSPMDDQLRIALFRAIYGFPTLEKYSLGVQKPIRIIVKSGHVTLEGIVDNEADKNTAGIRANGVPNVFSVTNNLRVSSS